jgi:Family of unknown function (DUF6496)
MAKYGETAQKEVHKQMKELKGEKKGSTKPKNRKQAIAIGLNKARKKGGKVPARKS